MTRKREIHMFLCPECEFISDTMICYEQRRSRSIASTEKSRNEIECGICGAMLKGKPDDYSVKITLEGGKFTVVPVGSWWKESQTGLPKGMYMYIGDLFEIAEKLFGAELGRRYYRAKIYKTKYELFGILADILLRRGIPLSFIYFDQLQLLQSV